MDRLDRRFSEMRRAALASPKTRGAGEVVPAALPAGIAIGLSVNK